MAEKQLYPVKWPAPKSKLLSLARILVSNCDRFNGRIPVGFVLARTLSADRDWLPSGLHQLRTKYSYYCRLSRDLIVCAPAWPQCHREAEWNGRTYAWVYGPAVVFDPRLNAPTLKYKYRLSESNTFIEMIRKRILRSRAAGTHILPCQHLFEEFGSRKVFRAFATLNAHHGFHIRKLNKGKPDGLWIIDRDRNVQLSSDTLIAAFDQEEAELDRKYGKIEPVKEQTPEYMEWIRSLGLVKFSEGEE